MGGWPSTRPGGFAASWLHQAGHQAPAPSNNRICCRSSHTQTTAERVITVVTAAQLSVACSMVRRLLRRSVATPLLASHRSRHAAGAAPAQLRRRAWRTAFAAGLATVTCNQQRSTLLTPSRHASGLGASSSAHATPVRGARLLSALRRCYPPLACGGHACTGAATHPAAPGIPVDSVQGLLAVGSLLLAEAHHCRRRRGEEMDGWSQAPWASAAWASISLHASGPDALRGPLPTPHRGSMPLTNVHEAAVVLQALHRPACGLLLLVLLGHLGRLSTHLTGTSQRTVNLACAQGWRRAW